MGELNRAYAAVAEGTDPDAEARLYELIRARVIDDAFTALGPLMDGLEAEGRHVTAAYLRDVLLRVRDGDG